MSSLKVLYVSVEVAPFAKVGGLADVAGSLPKALKELGHDVRIAMPNYGMVARESATPVTKKIPAFRIDLSPNYAPVGSLSVSELDGVPVYLIGVGDTFDQIQRSEDIYSPGRDTYLAFSLAILRACEAEGWIPDVIHCNDWHTGFLPVLLRERGGNKWAKTSSVYSIHNMAYQGEFGPDTIAAAGLPSSLFNMHQLETWGGVNFLKSGCVYAEAVNTVSPTYAKEIQTEEYGVRLHGLMGDLAAQGRLYGILNGINLTFFNPEIDPLIPANFTVNNLDGKAKCKAALQREIGLPELPNVPLVSVVSRLSNQKGFDHMIRQAYGMLDLPVQFAVLGTGDPWAASELRKLEKEWPDNVRLVERFDAPLAQRFYAASDLFLMPSAFEPCGLGQMIAMRYGAVPVVRTTGGLADTVFDNKNGFTFTERDPRQLFDTIKRAVSVYHKPSEWSEIVSTGMNGDYGWTESAGKYVEMYDSAVATRRGKVLVGA